MRMHLRKVNWIGTLLLMVLSSVFGLAQDERLSNFIKIPIDKNSFNKIYALRKDNNGIIWLATNTGPYYLDGQKLRKPILPNHVDDEIIDIFNFNTNKLLILPLNGEIKTMEHNYGKAQFTKIGKASTNLRKIKITNRGNETFILNDSIISFYSNSKVFTKKIKINAANGVSAWFNGKFVYLIIENKIIKIGLPSLEIISITTIDFEIKHGRYEYSSPYGIFFLTTNNQLVNFKDEKITKINLPSNLFLNFNDGYVIKHFNGYIYISNLNKLYRGKITKGEIQFENMGEFSSYITDCIFTNSKLIISTESSGLFYYSGERLITANTIFNSGVEEISKVYFEENGIKIFGSSNGKVFFSTNFEHYSEVKFPGSLSSSQEIKQIVKFRDKILICSNTGFYWVYYASLLKGNKNLNANLISFNATKDVLINPVDSCVYVIVAGRFIKKYASNLELDSAFRIATKDRIKKAILIENHVVYSSLNGGLYSVTLRNSAEPKQIFDSEIVLSDFIYNEDSKKLFFVNGTAYLFELDLNTYQTEKLNLDYKNNISNLKIDRIFKRKNRYFFFSNLGTFSISDQIKSESKLKFISNENEEAMIYFNEDREKYYLFYPGKLKIANKNQEINVKPNSSSTFMGFISFDSTIIGFKDKWTIPAGISTFEINWLYGFEENHYFKYQLKNFNSTYKSTFLNHILFDNVGPGNYTLLLEVYNSNYEFMYAIEKDIKVRYFWYQHPLFYVLIALFFISIIWFLIYQKKEKYVQDKANMESRLMGLTKNLNPHFLHNSLNSIQSLIITNEVDKASYYISIFSTLLNNYLVKSQNKFVKLEEELSAIKIFLEIESLRFSNNFEYEVVCEPNIEKLNIPPFFIQPIVENAIWHGLLPSKNNQKLLQIILSVIEGKLVISIKDNGIGINNKLSKDADSMALSSIFERIILINKLGEVKIKMDFENFYKTPLVNNELGTIVNIEIEYGDKISIN